MQTLSAMNSLFDRGDFSAHFCQQVTSYLTPKDTASLGESSKTLHAHLTMRLPTGGENPITDGNFKSIMENKFDELERSQLGASALRAQVTAKESIGKYLPIDDDADPRAEQIKDIVQRYENILTEIYAIDVKVSAVKKSPFLTSAQKASTEWRSRIDFYDCCQQALNLEREVQNMVDQGIVSLQPRMVF